MKFDEKNLQLVLQHYYQFRTIGLATLLPVSDNWSCNIITSFGQSVLQHYYQFRTIGLATLLPVSDNWSCNIITSFGQLVLQHSD
jgi:type III secretory pathway component EscS